MCSARRITNRTLGTACLVACLLSSEGAVAGTATGSFAVQLTITASCVISSTATLNFGSQGVLSSDVNQSTSLGVQCTSLTPYAIALSAGAGSGATTTTRKMTSSGNTIDYSLYQDSNHTTVWGTTGGELVSGTGSGSTQSYTIYGQIPAQSTPAAGSYSDTIGVTVSY